MFKNFSIYASKNLNVKVSGTSKVGKFATVKFLKFFVKNKTLFNF